MKIREETLVKEAAVWNLVGVATLYSPTSAWLVSVPVTCTPAIGQNVSSRRNQHFEWQCGSTTSLISPARRLDQVLM